MVSLWDKFSEPHLRPLRAGVFALFGLSGIFPGFHWLAKQNWFSDVSLRISFGCLVLMGVLYLTGALLYACRVPERFFPGKCDIWFHSHQLFHILVIAAAIVHYRGISELALHRFNTLQTCMVPTKDMSWVTCMLDLRVQRCISFSFTLSTLNNLYNLFISNRSSTPLFISNSFHLKLSSNNSAYDTSLNLFS